MNLGFPKVRDDDIYGFYVENKVFGKVFRSMELDLESFGLRLKTWLWKGEREDDEMSRGNRMIGTYFITQGIYQEIRSHEPATQENPPKILENKRYTLPPKEST